MPVAFNVNEWMNERLEQLPEREASKLWKALEAANAKIVKATEAAIRRQSIGTDFAEAQKTLTRVAREWRVNPEALTTASRLPRLVAARRQFAVLATTRHGLTVREAARLLQRDQSSVGHAIRSHAAALERDPHYRTHWQALTRQLDAPTFPTPTR